MTEITAALAGAGQARRAMRNIRVPRRRFDREAKVESRVFCPCELCRLRFGRMLYSRKGGDPIRSYRPSAVPDPTEAAAE